MVALLLVLLGGACGRGRMQVPRSSLPDAATTPDAAIAPDRIPEVTGAEVAVPGDRPDDRPDVAADGVPRSSCGNGRYDPSEECDDGNDLSGDGCSASCKLECGDAGVAPCIDPGFFPQSPWYLCCAPRRPIICGDGLRSSSEVCDDGTPEAGDGCSSDCQVIEPGYRCIVPGRACTPICGDGVVKGGETCDDGNTESGDGCSPFCLFEPGGVDAQVPVLFCGDGIRSGAEECDLGPDNGKDGSPCSARCAYLYCGDGVVSPGEGCDLGAQNGSRYGTQGGCTLACTPSHYCGDGILDIDYGEQCDLGDRNGASLCRVDCRVLPNR